MDIAVKRDLPTSFLVFASVVTAGLIFAFDLSFPLGVAGGVPYMALVLLGLIVHRPRAVILFAIIGTVLTIVGFFASNGTANQAVYVNRGLAVFAIWTTAIVSVLHLKTLTVLSPLANTDQLTGLFNRHYFAAEAVKQIELFRRHKHPLSAIILDIDHFKKINDTFGHPAGDRALQVVADAFRNQVRRVDSVARIGGEEFAVLLPATDLDGAMTTADRIRGDIEALDVEYEGVRFQLTASLGVVEMQDDSWSIAELLKAADEALYQAKEAGRNQVVSARYAA